MILTPCCFSQPWPGFLFPRIALPFYDRTALYARFTSRAGGEKAISRESFRAVFERMGVSDARVIESAFNAWDADGNGEISFSEFASVCAVQKEGTKREKLELLFEVWDVDGNGIITRNEMLKIFQTLCPGAPAAETSAAVANTFRQLDADGSGTISRGEFVCALWPVHSFSFLLFTLRCFGLVAHCSRACLFSAIILCDNSLQR